MPSVATLIEQFNSFDNVRWVNSYGNFSVVGGRGRLNVTTTYSGFYTPAEWSLPNGAGLYLRVWPDTVAGTAEAFTGVRFMHPTTAGTDLGIEYNANGNTIKFQNRVGYNDAGQVNVTYSPTNMAWWRILRTSATSITFSTAPDNGSGAPGTWTVQRTLSSMPSWVDTATNLRILLETHRDGGTNGFSEFDAINTSIDLPTLNGKFFAVF